MRNRFLSLALLWQNMKCLQEPVTFPVLFVHLCTAHWDGEIIHPKYFGWEHPIWTVVLVSHFVRHYPLHKVSCHDPIKNLVVFHLAKQQYIYSVMLLYPHQDHSYLPAFTKYECQCLCYSCLFIILTIVLC